MVEGKNKEKRQSEAVVKENKNSDDFIAISSVGDMIGKAVEPIAKSQEIAAKEATNQAKIVSDTYVKIAKYILLFGIGILVFTVIALLTGKEDIAIQIMMGLFGIIGGFGVSVRLLRDPNKRLTYPIIGFYVSSLTSAQFVCLEVPQHLSKG